jgi:hypothetical protein
MAWIEAKFSTGLRSWEKQRVAFTFFTGGGLLDRHEDGCRLAPRASVIITKRCVRDLLQCSYPIKSWSKKTRLRSGVDPADGAHQAQPV